MSTRAQIIVAENEGVKIYKHHDGYPKGVLPLLEPLVQDFKKARGWDPEYLTARIVQVLTNAAPGSSGIGVDTGWHGDIEYAYRVNPDFSIDYVSVGWDSEPIFPERKL